MIAKVKLFFSLPPPRQKHRCVPDDSWYIINGEMGGFSVISHPSFLLVSVWPKPHPVVPEISFRKKKRSLLNNAPTTMPAEPWYLFNGEIIGLFSSFLISGTRDITVFSYGSLPGLSFACHKFPRPQFDNIPGGLVRCYLLAARTNHGQCRGSTSHGT